MQRGWGGVVKAAHWCIQICSTQTCRWKHTEIGWVMQSNSIFWITFIIGWGWACSLCHNLLQTCNYQFISFYSLQPQSFPNLYHSCQTCIVESKNWKMSANIGIQHNPAFGRIYKYRYSCLVIVLILQDKYWKKSCSGMHLLEQAVRISYPEGPLTCIVLRHSRQLCFVILNVFFSPCVPPSVFQ